MATPFSIFQSSLCTSFLVISIMSKSGAYAFEGRKIAELISPQYAHVIDVTNLLPSPDCKQSTQVAKSKASLEVVHKHGPCSQLSQNNKNAPNLIEILVEDQSRVDSIHSRLSENEESSVKESNAVKLPVKSGMSLGTGNYIVNIGLGSPQKILPLIFDTGSDLTWARCTGAQTFNPTQSASYHNVSCSDPLCASVLSATGVPPRCITSTCEYGIQYGDGSYSIGFVAKEKLTISTDTFNDFKFGCGQQIEGLFGKAAGLLGLGRDPFSVVQQTASNYNKLFSYCLPSSSSTGFLSFGSSQSKSPKYTPLSKSSGSSFYDLNLIGISVGGKKLAIPSSVFQTAGTIIDSGTVITRLPPAAYSALKTAFRQVMGNYPLAQPLSILDTCYDFTNYQTVNVPKIVISFSGVDVNVDQSGIFVANGKSQVCLAFAPNSDARDKTIFGNTQQRNFEVIYDVAKGKVGFAPANCA